MREVPPDERTGPRSEGELTLPTLYALRNAAIAHGQDKTVLHLDALISQREKGAGKRR